MTRHEGWSGKFKAYKKGNRTYVHTWGKRFNLHREYVIKGKILTLISHEPLPNNRVRISTIVVKK